MKPHGVGEHTCWMALYHGHNEVNMVLNGMRSYSKVLDGNDR